MKKKFDYSSFLVYTKLHASLCKIICFFVYSIFSNIQVFAQCIDFTNLRSENVTCTYGSFSNPYQHIGIIDDGPSKISSRHTIHRDANETDPRTGNQLHTVPPGEIASVRLGNWKTGAEAESITYQYFVDSDETPILVCKYAAVMQDPNHTPEQQPHLKLEILDESNNLVDSYCGAFDFIASSSLGWNQSNDGVLWKDWTAVGLDLSNYKGQTVRIRFTNYDCQRAGHYGYAYINISCQKKKIQSLTCGLNNMTTFSGPDGFDYMWYKMDGANKMYIGTDQEITVPTDETTYYCEVSQTGKPTCSFTLDFKATSTYLFEHTETICENDFYDFRGRKIHQPGVYYDSLIATTGCDSVYKLILKTNPTFFEEINATICDNEYYNFGGKHLNKPGVYYDSLVAFTGCDSVIKLMLKVNPTYIFEHTETICNNEVYHFRGKQLNKSGVYYDSLMSMQGCDSVYKLNLIVLPDAIIENKELILCASELPYQWFDQTITKSGKYTMAEQYVATNCDSVVHVLTLQTYVQTLPSLITNPIARIGEAIDVSYSTDEILSHILMEPWYAPNAIVTWYIMDGNTWHILTDEPIKSDVSKITLKYIIDSDCGRVVSDEMIISVLTTKLKENLNCTTGTKKIFYNDQLIILRDGKTFSVIGQEM